MIHTVQLNQIASKRWRNDGGSTQELLTWPVADDWLVRISVARIERPGPFSAYPAIERWFAVIDGGGVLLRFGSKGIVLRADSGPLCFDGAAAPGCELLSDATEDLNLMVLRDAGHGEMRRVAAGEPWLTTARLRAVYAGEAAVLYVDEHHRTMLPANTLAWSDDAAGQWWQLVAAGGDTGLRAWWLAFMDVTSPALPHAN